jgi:hypothetical protein
LQKFKIFLKWTLWMRQLDLLKESVVARIQNWHHSLQYFWFFQSARQKMYHRPSLKNQVPHSRCSLSENPKFLEKFWPKNYKPIKIFDWYFHVNSTIVILARHYKIKSIVVCHKIAGISTEKICKTYVKNIRALRIRHLPTIILFMATVAWIP